RHRGASAVDPRTDPALNVVRPVPLPELPLKGHGRLDGGGGLRERREELVGPGVDLMAGGPAHRAPHDPPNVGQQASVAVAEPADDTGEAADRASASVCEGGPGRLSSGGRALDAYGPPPRAPASSRSRVAAVVAPATSSESGGWAAKRSRSNAATMRSISFRAS